MDISISNVKSSNILYPKINIHNNTYPYQINKNEVPYITLIVIYGAPLVKGYSLLGKYSLLQEYAAPRNKTHTPPR